MKTKINDIVTWIEQEVKNADAKGVVVGISGGIDSAVVAALAKKAFPESTLGLWIGIDNKRSSRRNSLRIFQSLGIKEVSLNLKFTFDQFVKDTFELEILDKDDPEFLEAFAKKMNGEELPKDKSYLELDNYQEITGNIKARLRTAVLYAWAQRNNYLVLNTSNLSESYVGYYTKWGDEAGDLAPIAHLTKKEVYEVAEILEIPKMVINAQPAADLWTEQKSDEEEMGVSYEDIDNFLINKPISEDKKTLIEQLHEKNEHKFIGVKKLIKKMK